MCHFQRLMRLNNNKALVYRKKKQKASLSNNVRHISIDIHVFDSWFFLHVHPNSTMYNFSVPNNLLKKEHPAPTDSSKIDYTVMPFGMDCCNTCCFDYCCCMTHLPGFHLFMDVIDDKIGCPEFEINRKIRWPLIRTNSNNTKSHIHFLHFMPIYKISKKVVKERNIKPRCGTRARFFFPLFCIQFLYCFWVMLKKKHIHIHCDRLGNMLGGNFNCNRV